MSAGCHRVRGPSLTRDDTGRERDAVQDILTTDLALDVGALTGEATLTVSPARGAGGVALDVSGNTELAEKLNACFDSQIAGGKNYGEAVMGRRKANATFFNSHNIDIIDQLWFAMDLTPLAEDDTLDITEFVKAKITRFEDSVVNGLG